MVSPGHTEGYSETQRMCFYGNSFYCIVMAKVMSPWCAKMKYLPRLPTVEELWMAAGYGNGWRMRRLFEEGRRRLR